MDGARTPSNSSPIPPWRSTSRSSIESAPAIIPATTPPTVNGVFAPSGPATLRRSATSSASPQSWARRITGTSPAHDTRFDSSKCADVAAALCHNRIYEMPLAPG